MRTLTQPEIEARYDVAAEFVRNELSNSDSPAMHLARYTDCQINQTHFSCPINSVNTLDITGDVARRIDAAIPGAFIRMTRSIDGTEMQYKFHIPIRVAASGGGGAHAGAGRVTKRTLEWPLTLLVVDLLLVAAMYYRFTVGLVL